MIDLILTPFKFKLKFYALKSLIDVVLRRMDFSRKLRRLFNTSWTSIYVS